MVRPVEVGQGDRTASVIVKRTSGMKKSRSLAWLLPAAVLFFITVSCEKNINNTVKQSAIDKKKIESFLAGHCLTPSGEIVDTASAPAGSDTLTKIAKYVDNTCYVMHIQEGAGIQPKETEKVSIRFKGYHMEGFYKFDSDENEPEPYKLWLSGAIEGLKKGIARMKTASVSEQENYLTPGEAWIIIPSTKAFGSTGKADPFVPPNTCVIYRITLYSIVDLQN